MELTFDHIAQQVPDIAQAVAWYQDLVPDTRILYQDATWALIDAAGAKLAFVMSEQHPNHLAWRVSNEHLEHMAKKHGQEIKPHRDGTRSFYLEAPGDKSIEIISYPQGDSSNPSKLPPAAPAP